MQNLRRHTDAADAAQRYAATEAGREREQMDAVSVLLVVRMKLAEGREDEAREIVKKYKNGEL